MLAVNIGILDFLSMLLNVFAVVAVDAVHVAALLAVVVDGVIASVVAAHNVGELLCVCVHAIILYSFCGASPEVPHKQGGKVNSLQVAYYHCLGGAAK